MQTTFIKKMEKDVLWVCLYEMVCILEYKNS